MLRFLKGLFTNQNCLNCKHCTVRQIAYRSIKFYHCMYQDHIISEDQMRYHCCDKFEQKR